MAMNIGNSSASDEPELMMIFSAGVFLTKYKINLKISFKIIFHSFQKSH